ncbi:peptidyl-prolyl isomerase CWC27 [Cryptococcus deuterogattii 99/473]|uniref:Peptidyl-prolyl isomerase CWC27 n=2 Tax=Cryptococcus deuterogattii TaxID=1859096 RepID=A0A0D0V3I9_9TREE|nr:peptidyl-prolyl isomerase CWC27 [Cryptococcus deuterogattii R265]KIR26307.1 peptidyl-prolyl isomerase CWC27 [Cryptococcus deuterogattii LA55]KIR41099.1 peptidyl-prolyl isomerase CWC27 [Cryptococcus deuterogattii Ram5]KIR72454.1 peptidyl-prolyl isomerase CWC27 [Cryptococcus deuterogattii CA1014]KIR92047.1 peptidyl-prolyl isomerase CWC27 [Cryptococcus deuterogattii CBS 10090]KIR97859.1 peptidyl-prolyl isomerase CWC27 [Cryptococcus deuterogattii 2001/935-1]KIY57279.1 peptidyl-prolyl isomerase
MSNLYATEPATNGKVIIDTTAGEIEVELWGKECPKAVRNFLALTMEGYYDGVLFHRVVPGFIIQSGDPTGTGMGGESFYGEPFQDEIHGRLKFNRRGLLGMANNGSRNSNTSQFFITLDAAPELTNKHTMFGKVVGNTIFNVLNIGNLDTDKEEKPLIPPKIRRIHIIENPFDDIVPRITAEEKKAQQKAKLEAKKDMEQRERRAKAKKNTGLLSFGDSEEIPEEAVTIKKKSMTRQDLVDPSEAQGSEPRTLKMTETFVNIPPSLKDLDKSRESEAREEKKAVDLKNIRAKHEREKTGGSAARQAEIKRMEENLRRLKKRSGSLSDSGSDSSSRARRKGPSYLEQELAKYASNRGRAAMKAGNKRSRRDEEEDVLAEMRKFSSRVMQAEDEPEEEQAEEIEEGETKEGTGIGAAMAEEERGIEVDDDIGWLKHKLKFHVDEKELTRRAEDEYAVIDPRAKARDLQEKPDKKKWKGNPNRRTVRDVARNR